MVVGHKNIIFPLFCIQGARQGMRRWGGDTQHTDIPLVPPAKTF